MTLTHYIGGKLTGLTVDFPPSLNYPNLTTFINSETFEEFILVSGVWEQVGVIPPPPPIDVTELKAYWKFNETSGDIINQATTVGSVDSLGSAADLQVTGATFNNPNFPFNTMDFDGISDLATAGSSLSQFNFMHDGGKWTVCLWIDVNSTTDEGFIFNDLGGGNIQGVKILQSASAALIPNIFDSGLWVNANFGASGLSAGTSFFLTFTFDKDEPTDKAVYFRNAVEIAAVDQSIAQGTSANSTRAFEIAGDNFLGCKIAEMSVWNRILTDQEVIDLYNDGNGRVIGS